MGSVLAFMALTQRLEFRQSQSLVMTPQLMQAIKLLQLSNLDLTTFVEEELERNPLLERAPTTGAAGGGRSPGRERPVQRFRADGSQRWRPSRRSAAARRRGAFEPGQEEWMNKDLGTRAEIEQTLDTGLDNVFSEEPAEAAARNAPGCGADHLHRMGRRRLRRRGLQSRSLRRRGDHARRPSGRAALGRLHRRRRSA